jgi:membrane associated rhomboid family serine protease
LYGRGPQVGFGPPVFPDVIKAIIIANCAVYLLQILGPGWITPYLALTPAAVWELGAVWQIPTYMWLHSPGSVMHLLFNMFALWMFGSQVASTWGTQKFLRFYLICGVGAGVIIAAWPALLVLIGIGSDSYSMPTLGASGAVYGVLLAFSLLWPDRTIMLLFPPIPLTRRPSGRRGGRLLRAAFDGLRRPHRSRAAAMAAEALAHAASAARGAQRGTAGARARSRPQELSLMTPRNDH